MGKSVFITEKPSVAVEFAKALKLNSIQKSGYMESETAIVTWCVGHLVTMSYPEVYNEKYKKWTLKDLPFIPKEWKYEVIPGVRKQFEIVKKLLTRNDVDTIYICTDSGREGEYIYRLVAQEIGITGKQEKRVWIDSQTEEEILRGIREAKALSAYDQLSDAAYLRAKEDYLMGINFSRLLTLKYGNSIQNFLKGKWRSVNVGRVMTCVLGMICSRERDIRNFIKRPFYRVMAKMNLEGKTIAMEWKAVKGSHFFQSPLLYNEKGFHEKTSAQALIDAMEHSTPLELTVKSVTVKEEKKQPPLLYNLAELQNDCSKMFKISPDETLNAVQQLYENKLVTYPRTDARVLSTAVAKEIYKNLSGIQAYSPCATSAKHILENGLYKGLEKTKYTDDKKITDHYAIIPTGQGLQELAKQKPVNRDIYAVIVKRFLSIFYPSAIYKKATLTGTIPAMFHNKQDIHRTQEQFGVTFKILVQKGYFEIIGVPKSKKVSESCISEQYRDIQKENSTNRDIFAVSNNEETEFNEEFFERLNKLNKGAKITVGTLTIKEGETTPPKRYTSGSLILAMENAGQLIEDEELREQIKGSGIGTSATRAEIIKKLTNIHYLSLNKKTQVIKPTQLGEMIFGVVHGSIKSLLNPELTASWEMGLTKVAEGKLSADEYMEKLNEFIVGRFNNVVHLNNVGQMNQYYRYVARFYDMKGE